MIYLVFEYLVKAMLGKTIKRYDIFGLWIL